MEQEGLAFLHFECIKGPKLVFRKYVRTFTYQTLGDIIENLIPEGESIVSIFSEIDHSELHAGMTRACLDDLNVKRVKIRDSPTHSPASKTLPSVFDVLMEETSKTTSLPARRLNCFHNRSHVLLFYLNNNSINSNSCFCCLNLDLKITPKINCTTGFSS